MSTLQEFLLAEIEKDVAEGERFARLARLARMQAWEEGRIAGLRGAQFVDNPYDA